MALWDAITGKILHFNTTKVQANHKVCTALKTFVSSRLPNYPKGEKLFVQGRNELYAFYLGATGFISCNVDDSLAKYKRGLFSLNVHNYLCLISALHMGYVVAMYLSERESPAARNWFYLLSEGICDMYCRADNYAVEWFNRLDWICENEEAIGGRLSYKVYDEIAPILGLPQNDPIECATWSSILTECVRCRKVLHDQADWNTEVETELAAH